MRVNIETEVMSMHMSNKGGSCALFMDMGLPAPANRSPR